MDDPLRPDEARKLIRDILTNGVVSLSDHACGEMSKDDLTMVDCTNALRCGVVEAPELIKGSWRYRVRTNRIVVVVAFRSETHLRIVTAWGVK